MDRPPNPEENPESQYRQRLGGQARKRAHSHKTRMTRARAPRPSNNKTQTPPLYIYYYLITPAGSIQMYSIAGGSGEEERQENMDK